MRVEIVAFTDEGARTGEEIKSRLEGAGRAAALTRCRAGALEKWTRGNFEAKNAMVFVGAAGIAVRAIAPHLKSKAADPPVIAVDERGRFVIPLASGHIGGANELAREIARMIGAVPVLTTATDCRGVFAVDSWAASRGVRIVNPEKIKLVSSRLLSGGTVRLRSDFPVDGGLPDGVEMADGDECDVVVTFRTAGGGGALRLVPPVLVLGVGARRGVSAAEVKAAFESAAKSAGVHEEAVFRVCSVDLKGDEAGIIAFCEERGLEFVTFSAEELMALEGSFSASKFVERAVGADNVCERSAVLGSGGGELVLKKRAFGGVTTALALSSYRVKFLED